MSGIVGGLQIHYAAEASLTNFDELGRIEDQRLIKYDATNIDFQADALDFVGIQDIEADHADTGHGAASIPRSHLG